MTVFFTAATIWAINSYIYKQKAFSSSSYVTAQVTYLLNSSGIRVSLNPTVIYKYTVDGKVYSGREPAADGFSPEIGDCIIVKYSIEDPNVSEMSMRDGVVSCN